MPNSYNLRPILKRKVPYSPPWPESKRVNNQTLNSQEMMDEASGFQDPVNNMVNTSLSSPNNLNGMLPSDQNVSPRDNNNPRRSLNPELPPFRPPVPQMSQPPYPHYQRYPPAQPNYSLPHSSFVSHANGQDSNLANYIQNAIRDGFRSNQNDPSAFELVRAIRDMTARIDTGFTNMQNQIYNSNGQNSNADVAPENGSQDGEDRPERRGQGQERDSTVSRLESMVQNLTLQVSSLSHRLDNSDHVAGSSSSRSAPYVASNWNYRPNPQKWNVKFSGVYVKGSKNKMSATDFLNIVSLKRDTYDVT